MPARTVKIRHDENTRAKIQTSQIINRLAKHILGKLELSPTQVRAAEILLKKTLPDLTNVEHSAGEGLVPFVMMGVLESRAVDEWEQQHSPKLLQ